MLLPRTRELNNQRTDRGNRSSTDIILQYNSTAERYLY